jgi:hypothetical protein
MNKVYGVSPVQAARRAADRAGEHEGQEQQQTAAGRGAHPALPLLGVTL